MRAGLALWDVLASSLLVSSRSMVNNACRTLATRRVRVAAWQMVSCPSDAKDADTGKNR